MTTRTLGLLASVTLAAMTGFPPAQALAANDNGGPPAPLQEAIDACANQKEKATCTVSFHGQSVQGKCVKGPEGQETLACMPPPPQPPEIAGLAVEEGDLDKLCERLIASANGNGDQDETRRGRMPGTEAWRRNVGWRFSDKCPPSKRLGIKHRPGIEAEARLRGV